MEKQKTNWARISIFAIFMFLFYLWWSGILHISDEIRKTIMYFLYPLFMVTGQFGGIGSWIVLGIIVILIVYFISTLLSKIINKL